jgi:hypothetical protein
MKKSELTELGIKLMLIYFLLFNLASLSTLRYYYDYYLNSEQGVLIFSVAVAVIIGLLLVVWVSAKRISAYVWRDNADDSIVVSVDANTLTTSLLSVAGILIVALTIPGFLNSLTNFILIGAQHVVDYPLLATLIGRLGGLVIGLALILDVRRITDFIARKWENPFDEPKSAPKAKKAKRK